MDFSFLRNWFSTTSTGASSIDSQLEQSSSILADDGKCKIEEYDDEFEIIEDYEFINPRDPNEPHSLPSSYQIDESIAEIAGFNKEKLLEMSNFCKISYGDNDNKLSEKRCNTLAEELYKTGFEVTTEGYEIIPSPEKMYKTRAELTKEGYEIIPFGNSFEKDAGHVFIKGKEITIAYHGTRMSHGLWGLNDLITDLNASFTTSELLPDGGRIHRGFYNSFTDSWPNLYGILKSHAEKQGSEIKDFKINLTGHSMGGAIAKIAALCLNKTEGAEDVHVATFGDPRVFDLAASKFYNDVLQEKTIRVTQHRQDPVPAVSPGLFGYAHVGAQLRISAPEGYSFHKIDGYHETVKVMDESDFKLNNNVSLFYYPVRALSLINCAILGNVQYCAANAVNYIVGGSNFFEEVKNKNSSQLEQAEVESSLSTVRSV
ncbi:lipase family protein [Wolbachia endosymbiont of Oedothorax gibbosus]|uniref:lipase family protein n=1 Tax=Wolbachia endosymbiont of Oedothorax gibbosus TaxID=931100 RepID=UPI0020257A4B|nr:lipase family protein [Wolbachia endosymbiont of Oedothorax gibbosus]